MPSVEILENTEVYKYLTSFLSFFYTCRVFAITFMYCLVFSLNITTRAFLLIKPLYKYFHQSVSSCTRIYCIFCIQIVFSFHSFKDKMLDAF